MAFAAKIPWIDKEFFDDYIENILAKYKPSKWKLLILDYSTAHVTKEIKKKLLFNIINFVFILK